jgi:hypothetical protein
MNIAIYSSTAGGGEKQELIESFHDGILNVNKKHKIKIVKDLKIVQADLAFVFGYCGKNVKSEKHMLRKRVAATQKQRKSGIIFLDADPLKYSGTIHPKSVYDPCHYFRLSYDSIFINKGYHFDKEQDPKRWAIIKKAKNIILKEKSAGEDIMICLNSDPKTGSGWTAESLNINDWVLNLSKRIRLISDKKIIIRIHPKSNQDFFKSFPFEELNGLENVKFTCSKENRYTEISSFDEDCSNVFACLSYTSSASINALINGVPLWTESKSHPAAKICNFDLENILTNPTLPDREPFLISLSNKIWSQKEIRKGVPWEKFEKELSSKGQLIKL